jgi:hypothetical protein
MKHKVGDFVYVRAKSWMDAQKKDSGGNIKPPKGSGRIMNPAMQELAGERLEIIRVYEDGVYLIRDSAWAWEDWMFGDGKTPLSAEEAIRAMLDGETLYSEDGETKYFWDGSSFRYANDGGDDEDEASEVIDTFDGLDFCRRPVKIGRTMTRWEAMDWANSEASRRWVVRTLESEQWAHPLYHAYDGYIKKYQRARLLPDLSGVDESTVCGFETEAEL